MQENNAKILIKNRQKTEDGDEVLTVDVPCRFMFKGDTAYILYKDEGVSSKIKTDGGTVTVTRMGEFSNEMVYQKGKKTSFLYKMPYGTLDMELKTNEVFVDLSENGGTIKLSYELLFSGTGSKNSMEITVKKLS